MSYTSNPSSGYDGCPVHAPVIAKLLAHGIGFLSRDEKRLYVEAETDCPECEQLLAYATGVSVTQFRKAKRGYLAKRLRRPVLKPISNAPPPPARGSVIPKTNLPNSGSLVVTQPGDGMRRVLHQATSSNRDVLRRIVIQEAEYARRDGKLSLSIDLIEEGLRVLPGNTHHERLFMEGVVSASQDIFPYHQLDRVSDLLHRSVISQELASGLQDLLRAKKLEETSTPLRDLQFPLPSLELIRASLIGTHLLMADQLAPLHEPVRVIQSLRSGSDTEAMLSELQAIQAYLHGRFPEATELHKRASILSEDLCPQIWFRLNAAASALETPDLLSAEAIAERAWHLAVSHDLPAFRLRAEQLLRSVAFRRDTPCAYEANLGEIRRIAPLQLVPACRTEMARAWRDGHRNRILELSASTPLNSTGDALLMRAMALTAQEHPNLDQVHRLARKAIAHPFPGVKLQVLAILSTTWRDHIDLAEWSQVGRACIRDIPQRLHLRREVLSPREALRSLRV